MSASFKVIKIDPEGSGVDYSGHLGDIVTDAQRCCKNCSIIFGTIGQTTDFGPFVLGELEPLNEEASAILEQINIHVQERIKAHSKKVTVVYSKGFQKALAKLTGEVYFDAPDFEIKKGQC